MMPEDRPGRRCPTGSVCDGLPVLRDRSRRLRRGDRRTGGGRRFLDIAPLFQKHVLLVPRAHVETLPDLQIAQVGPLFERAQRLAAAMESVLGAAGSFVALNNRISQSVPHLHVHVVPRNRKDGLKGFFWPRTRYADDDAMAAVAARLRAGLAA
jgi:histidine triad (HIT) family protein